MEPIETMSNRILNDIKRKIEASLYVEDRRIEDFAIVVTEENIQNKSPVLLQDAHLGLESWCVKHVYQYAYVRIMKLRKGFKNRTLDCATEDQLDHLLIGIVLINPDIATFWNMRRELIELGKLDIDFEIELCRLTLTRKNKSSEAFSYRRWIIQKTLEEVVEYSDPEELTYRMLDTEIKMCNKILVNTPDNYHCWTHRQFCMLLFGGNDIMQQSITFELEFINNWIKEHYSMSSGYHYKQFLINIVRHKRMYQWLPCINNEAVIKSTLILIGIESIPHNDSQFNISTAQNKYFDGAHSLSLYIGVLWYDLLNSDCNDSVFVHENYWLHRRFIIYKLLEAALNNRGETLVCNESLNVDCSGLDSNIINVVTGYPYHEIKRSKLLNSTYSKIENCTFFNLLLTSEAMIVKAFNPSGLCDVLKRHVFWLKNFLNFDVERSN